MNRNRLFVSVAMLSLMVCGFSPQSFGQSTIAAAAVSPVITRIMPEAASPGDLVIIEGTDLNLTQRVRFRATTGGFAGVQTMDVQPNYISPSRITAVMPGGYGFAPSNATPPGDPFGALLTVDVTGAETSKAALFFMEGTEGAIFTTGAGTTQTTGIGRPAISFDLAGGPPVGGNKNFVCTMMNASPGATAWLFVGAPAVGPLPAVGDGLFAIDLVHPSLYGFSPVLVDPTGVASVPISLPVFPTTVIIRGVFQWALYDPGASSLDFALSNAMDFRLQ